MTRLLEGIKVLDITAGLNGPCCGVWLSDYGASVTKVEPRLTGEYGRASPHIENYSFSPYFVCGNRGKKSVTVDLTKQEGREIVLKLAEKSDVLINNYRVGILEKLGLGYDVVKERNPRIIYAISSGYGHKGPAAKLPSNDFAAQAYGGIISVNGEEQQPLPVGASIADLGGTYSLALGVMMGLLARERFGIGQRIDTSLFGGQIMLQTWELEHYCMSGKLPDPLRRGRYHNLLAATYGMQKTKDGYIMCTWIAPEAWPHFCEELGEPELVGDPRFDPRLSGWDVRVKFHNELVPIMNRAFQKRTTQEWLNSLRNLGGVVIVSEIRTYEDVVNDPQASANGYIIEMDLPGLGPTKLVGDPVVLSETPAKPEGPPPELGQHTEEILLDLGYSWNDITKFKEGEVI